VEDETPSDDIETIPPRSIGGMASMIAALTALVLISIIAFWIIGTEQPAIGASASDSRIVIATEAAKRSHD
jgi:hypothetical protein